METKSEEAATTSGQPSQPQPNSSDDGVEKVEVQQVKMLKYKGMQAYKDSEDAGYSTVVEFESGEKVSFSDIKQGIKRLEPIMDSKSIVRFRNDLVERIKNGDFDSELMFPGATSDPEEKNQTKKFGYSGIELHEDNNGQSGIAHLLYKGSTYLTGVRDFDEFNRVCRDLDSESAIRFMDEVVKLQKDGKLQYLLPNGHQTPPYPQDVVDEQAEQDRQVKIEKLRDQLEELLFEERQLKVDSLSYFAVAEVVVRHMVNGLKSPELDPFFITMHNRNMVIRIIVDDVSDNENQRVLELVVDPRNFISQDTGLELSVLRKKVNSVIRELEKADK